MILASISGGQSLGSPSPTYRDRVNAFSRRAVLGLLPQVQAVQAFGCCRLRREASETRGLGSSEIEIMLLIISRCAGVFLRNTLKPSVLSLTECHSCQEQISRTLMQESCF